MGTYYIPRNYKGETRLLYIFSIKSLITTALGAIVGLVFYFIFSIIGLKMVGLISMIAFAVIGYCIGALKIPTIVGLPITKKIGGESISDIIIRYFKFKKSRKIYTYIDTVNTDVQNITKEEK